METKIEKLIFAVPIGFFVKMFPLFPLIMVGIAFVLADVYTAWRLSVRLRKDGKSSGKFKSLHAKRVIDTLIKMMLVIILAHVLESYVLTMLDTLYLSNWVTAIFCIVQFLSILENISSEGESKWARMLQKILVSKAARHYDLDLSDVIEEVKKENNGTEIKEPSASN